MEKKIKSFLTLCLVLFICGLLFIGIVGFFYFLLQGFPLFYRLSLAIGITIVIILVAISDPSL